MNRLAFLLSHKFSQHSSIAQSQSMKKFYKASSYTLNPIPTHPLHKYIIKLDDKTMRTPHRHLLAVPNPVLALLVTSQFNRQDKYLKTGEMPMLGLCRTAVDADLQGNITQHLKHSIFEYLKTDTLIFYQQYYQKQYKKDSLPLVHKFSNNFNIKIQPSSNLHPPQIKIPQQFISWVQNLNNWQLIGLETMTIWLKSTIAAYYLILSNNIDQCIKAANLEQIVQMSRNGQVEEKLMNLNQIRLMASCGLIMYHNGNVQEGRNIQKKSSDLKGNYSEGKKNDKKKRNQDYDWQEQQIQIKRKNN